MQNMELLRHKISESGYSMIFLASKIGVSRYCLYNRLTTPRNFRLSEIIILSDLLRLSDDEKMEIFLKTNVI